MFRFSIRDVLWLTVVVAFAVAWCIERQQRTTLSREFDVIQIEAQLSRSAIKSLHEDIDRITQDLPRHGLTVLWSKDMRPTVQPTRPTAAVRQ